MKQELPNFYRIKLGMPIKFMPFPHFVKSFMFVDYLMPGKDESFIVDKLINSFNIPYKIETYRNNSSFPGYEVVFMHVPSRYAKQLEDILVTSKNKLFHFHGNSKVIEDYDKVCSYIGGIACPNNA